MHTDDAAARRSVDTRPPDATSDELKGYRTELLAMKGLLAELRWQLALRRFSRKYRPDQLRDDRGRFADEGGLRRALARLYAAGMPRIPQQRPPDSQDRTAIAKAVASWLAEKGLAAADVIAKTSWLYSAIPTITSYFDAPKSLEELQEAASTPRAGYDRHHIVEQTAAELFGYPKDQIDAPENTVLIPRMKHWEINAWFQTNSKEYGGMTPREYLVGKDWDERTRVGVEALRMFGVLKP